MKDSYDVIVVGLGAMGTAASYQLAKAGAHVLGLDAYDPPHIYGSSHGETRITREAVGEGAQYTPLAIRSNQLWEELEELTGRSLLTRCGCLISGPGDVQTVQHGVEGFLDQTIEIAKSYKIPHEVLDASGLRKRFPMFNFDNGDCGYFEPGAGFVRPEACIEVQLGLARSHGATLLSNEAVHTIKQKGSGDVLVTTSKGSYTTKTLVLSVGASLSAFLPQSLQKHFKVYRQVLHWFEPEEQTDLFKPEFCPTFIRVGRRSEDMFYGFPLLGEKEDGMKIAMEQFVECCTPESIDRNVAIEEGHALHALLQSHMHVKKEVLRSLSCMYTVTPDCDFIIDWHPDHDSMLIVSPCSGHGFKHSSGIGELIKQMVLDETTAFDCRPFSFEQRLAHWA